MLQSVLVPKIVFTLVRCISGDQGEYNWPWLSKVAA